MAIDSSTRKSASSRGREPPSFDTAGYFADDPGVFAKVAPVFLGDDERPVPLSRLKRATERHTRETPSNPLSVSSAA